MQTYVTESLGPDSFQVTVEGPERMVLETPTHFDQVRCEYEFDVRLVASGPVYLDVIWMHGVGNTLHTITVGADAAYYAGLRRLSRVRRDTPDSPILRTAH